MPVSFNSPFGVEKYGDVEVNHFTKILVKETRKYASMRNGNPIWEWCFYGIHPHAPRTNQTENEGFTDSMVCKTMLVDYAQRPEGQCHCTWVEGIKWKPSTFDDKNNVMDTDDVAQWNKNFTDNVKWWNDRLDRMRKLRSEEVSLSDRERYLKRALKSGVKPDDLKSSFDDINKKKLKVKNKWSKLKIEKDEHDKVMK